MSANCCTSTYDIGCFDCGARLLTLPIVAAMTGTFRVFFKYAGREICFETEGVSGEVLTVGVSGLNENFTFYFYVLDPNGDRVPAVIDGKSYDCLSAKFHAALVGEPYVAPPSGTCDPVRIRNTSDSATLASVPSGDDYPLPFVRVRFTEADGTVSYVTLAVASISGGEIILNEPGGGIIPFPRFTVFESDGMTPNTYRDAYSPSFTLPAVVLASALVDPLTPAADAVVDPL